MKKTAVVIAVILAGFTTISNASPDRNTWYAGGKLSWPKFHGTCYISNNGSLGNYDQYNENQLVAGIFGGYQTNPYVSFEMGYDWLGHMHSKNNATNGLFKAQGIQLTTKLSYPITYNLDAYTRFGGMLWKADFVRNNNTEENYETGSSPVFGGGIEWKINQNIMSRLEYQQIRNIGNENTVWIHPDNSMLSLGISYLFGQKEVDSAIIPIPSSSKIRDREFALKSTVFFDFNQSNLNFGGQQTLDRLFDKIKDLNPKEISVMILGFSDRIGSNSYNYSLSEKRAQSVIEYLVFNGISKNKIFTCSMGEFSSITDNTCNNVKDRIKLINCLAPDRRVEIEVKGIKGDNITHHSSFS